jgi:hypothetical protein
VWREAPNGDRTRIRFFCLPETVDPRESWSSSPARLFRVSAFTSLVASPDTRTLAGLRRSMRWPSPSGGFASKGEVASKGWNPPTTHLAKINALGRHTPPQPGRLLHNVLYARVNQRQVGERKIALVYLAGYPVFTASAGTSSYPMLTISHMRPRNVESNV